MGIKLEKVKTKSAETTKEMTNAIEEGRDIVKEKERAAEELRSIPEGLDDEVARAIEETKKGVVRDASNALKSEGEKIETHETKLREIDGEASKEAQRAEEVGIVLGETKSDKGFGAREISEGISEARKSQEGFEKTVEENEATTERIDEDFKAQRARTEAAI